MLKYFNTTNSFVLYTLIFFALQGCSDKTIQIDSNLNNFENQDFMASCESDSPDLSIALASEGFTQEKPTTAGEEERIKRLVAQKSVATKTTIIKGAREGSLKHSAIRKEVIRESKEIKKEKKETFSTEEGKSRVVALILVFVIGAIGIHRFYLGYIGIGILQLFTLGGCGIWSLIDLIRIATGDLKPKNGEYEKEL